MTADTIPRYNISLTSIFSPRDEILFGEKTHYIDTSDGFGANWIIYALPMLVSRLIRKEWTLHIKTKGDRIVDLKTQEVTSSLQVLPSDKMEISKAWKSSIVLKGQRGEFLIPMNGISSIIGFLEPVQALAPWATPVATLSATLNSSVPKQPYFDVVMMADARRFLEGIVGTHFIPSGTPRDLHYDDPRSIAMPNGYLYLSDQPRSLVHHLAKLRHRCDGGVFGHTQSNPSEAPVGMFISSVGEVNFISRSKWEDIRRSVMNAPYGEDEVNSQDTLYRNCMIYVADKEKITSEDFVNRMVGNIFSKEGTPITRRELENRTHGEEEYESLPLPYVSMILPEHKFKGGRSEILERILVTYECVLIVTHQHSGNFSFEPVTGEGTPYMETLIQQVSEEMREELIASIS